MDFVVLSGPCTASGGCTQSPNYPAEYGPSESCEIVAPAKPLYFTDFATEDGYDLLKISGQAYSGSSHPPQGVITSDIVQWTSDSSVYSNGWQICIVSGLKLARCFLCQFQGRYVKSHSLISCILQYLLEMCGKWCHNLLDAGRLAGVACCAGYCYFWMV